MSIVARARRSRRRTRRLARRLAGLALLAMLIGAGSWHLSVAPSPAPIALPASGSVSIALPASGSASIALPASAVSQVEVSAPETAQPSQLDAPLGVVEGLVPRLLPLGPARDTASALLDGADRSANGTRAPPPHNA